VAPEEVKCTSLIINNTRGGLIPEKQEARTAVRDPSNGAKHTSSDENRDTVLGCRRWGNVNGFPMPMRRSNNYLFRSWTRKLLKGSHSLSSTDLQFFILLPLFPRCAG
jgi:hypothetical protein